MMMAVSFERYGRLWAPQWVPDDIDGLPVCIAAKRLIREHGLPMKVTAVDHAGPGRQAHNEWYGKLLRKSYVGPAWCNDEPHSWT